MATKQSEYVDKSRKLARLKKVVVSRGGSVEPVMLVRMHGQTQIRQWNGSQWEKVEI